MSAQPQLSAEVAGVSTSTVESLTFTRMQVTDLEQILAIEQQVYPHPWTHGNFLDSLVSGYEAWIARDASDALIGYFLAMKMVDEVHLLNIAVPTPLQGRGLGIALLNQVVTLARAQEMTSILLEVRPSNQRAYAVYARYGFQTIGRRKAYYPAVDNTREDAIVMRLAL